MHQPIWQYNIFALERGQPLYNGQNNLSQCVRYLEVPLYKCCGVCSVSWVCFHYLVGAGQVMW